jgi:DNA repair exonuclease SbcCD ATPase subunit
MPALLLKNSFPTLRRIVLRRFSLYSREPEVDEEIAPGVFCLAGANGLGKSTFLAAANFGLTGIVSEPSRRFASAEEYYKHSHDFSEDYFEGRISERDREAAEVTLEFAIADRVFQLTRGVFEPDELRQFAIVAKDGTVEFEAGALTASERHREYTTRLTAAVGLASFEQFVFLQHFVLTFDERRHLLFWDERTLEQALFLAFGVDNASARRADVLRREVDRADSLARNANWQATEVRKKIKDLRTTSNDLGSDADDDLVQEHEGLSDALSKATARVEKLKGQQRDASLQLAELSASQATLRTQYEQEFAQRIRTTTHMAHHPLVLSSLEGCACGLCGTRNAKVRGAIEQRVRGSQCPLCASEVEQERTRPKDVAQLKKLDEQIAAVKANLDDVVKQLQRLEAEITRAESDRDQANAALRAFEKENYEAVAKGQAGKGIGGVGAVVTAYERQMAEFLSEKKKQYDRRDDRKKELTKLQRDLEQRYAEAEEVFVPQFKRLASSFVGLDLDVRMEANSRGTGLVLEVKNSARREQHQLSESQRFFIDIALRMALAQFMSAPGSKATLFIDTPEGSLDIAYESRAGAMLAMFAEQGFNIVMTANINSSRLLISLAQKLGRSKMHLCRMMSWTELSEVQEEEEDLFADAYKQIETAMGPVKKGRRS